MIQPAGIRQIDGFLAFLRERLAPCGVGSFEVVREGGKGRETLRRVVLDDSAETTVAVERPLAGRLLLRVHGREKGDELARALDEAASAFARFALESLADDLTTWDEAGFLRGGAFAELFDLELRRARRYNHLLGYLVVEAEGSAAHARTAALLREALRDTDAKGVLAPGRFGVLLIGADADGVERVAARLVEAGRAAGVSLSTKSAIFPYDGLDRAALEEAVA